MTRGPVPKHSSERVRRNVDEPVQKISASANLECPELDFEGNDRDLHPLAVDLYESLRTSGQSQFYTDSDWQMARILCHLLSDVLRSSRPSAQMIAALNSQMSNLLLTEGDRRRVRLEVERGQAEAQVLDVAKMLEDRMKAARSGQLNMSN